MESGIFLREEEYVQSGSDVRVLRRVCPPAPLKGRGAKNQGGREANWERGKIQ